MNIWQLETEYLRRVAADPVMTALSRKIDRGAATFAETAQYSERMSNLLGETLSKHITEIPEHERAAICEELLKGRYTDINEQLEAVQKALDRANGINIAPQRAKFPTERVRKVAGALMDTTASDEVIRRRANGPVANVSKSFHDDYMKRNAEFRSRAGLQCYIDREAAPGCCAWCSEIAGRYEYGNQPDDVFRRHDNCSCTTTFENGRQRQDVWSKKKWEVPEPGAGAAPLTVFDDETRPTGFQPRVLTGNSESGKIKIEGINYDFLNRKASLFSYEEDLKAVNPSYVPHTEYGNNCQRCVPTFVLRRRGYDVIALPTGSDTKADEFLFNNPEAIWKKNGSRIIPHPTRGSVDYGKTEIEKFMETLPEGAMCEVRCEWADKQTGHVFIALKSNDGISYIDPQTGSSDVSSYFSQMAVNSTTFWRIDDAEIIEHWISVCCK